ncbi:hypothetical protein C8D77_1395, partial [Mesorhizobium loti]
MMGQSSQASRRTHLILTAYDNEHFTVYMRLLDASSDDASEDEMAQL